MGDAGLKGMKYQRKARWAVGMVAGVSLALVGAACAATTHPGANPHDMSAAEHREHAAAERDEAQAHEDRYDPNASGEISTGGPFGYAYGVSVYNPTGHHTKEAAEHRAHAEAHQAAAQALEQFEHEACKDLPPETRTLCPLLGQISSADDTPQGVVITPEPDVNRDALLAHMRCHLAYAATVGFEGMDACPLYVEGVTIEDEGGTIRLRAADEASAQALQKRTTTHVGD